MMLWPGRGNLDCPYWARPRVFLARLLALRWLRSAGAIKPLLGKKYTFDDDFGGSYTFDDSESQPTLLMIPPYRDVPAARKHKGSVGTSWMYEIDVLKAKDESVDLLSCCWLIHEKSA